MSVVDATKIYHEVQEGNLCAQHALNALLQGPYFTAVDLAELARGIDERERMVMPSLRGKPSENYDDSGFFSIGTISSALETFGLELVPTEGERGAEARTHPAKFMAFLLNRSQHWFTVRRFGDVWFDCNSTRTRPEKLTPSYLEVFLATMRHDGYSVFVVMGLLPACAADPPPPPPPVDQDDVRKKRLARFG